MLNSRLLNATLKRIDEANLTEYILPVASIHDATYFLVRNKPEYLEFIQKVVEEEASWNDLPDIKHDVVKPSGSLDVFYPDWSNPIKPKEFINKE